MKVSCTECGALILPQTSALNGGLCAPCKNGTRQSLNAALKQREKEKTDPFHILFRRIRDHAATHGFTKLSPHEATFYAVSALFSDLYRGGVQLFFNANSPVFRKLATDGLTALGRSDLLASLNGAGELCEEQEKWRATAKRENIQIPHEEELARITDQILDASEDIFLRLEHFAVDKNLVSNVTPTRSPNQS